MTWWVRLNGNSSRRDGRGNQTEGLAGLAPSPNVIWHPLKLSSLVLKADGPNDLKFAI